MSKEFRRLYQGYKSPTGEHNTKGTDTCAFITKQAVPKAKKTTYIRIVSEYREQKEDPYRIRMTVDGNLIEVTGDISTKGADLVTAKVLINDIISTPNCRATVLDIKDFYLNNELPEKE
jgi:Reverse transcriptase (RNA-dependent DNA polymerase)